MASSNVLNPIKGIYWLSDTGFPAADIDSSLFTHIFCAFADLDNNRVTISQQNLAAFSTFTQTVQRRNPSVTTLLSIGGGGGNALREAFASMASDPNSRRTFIDSSINVARSNNFHGLDLDWEYPSTRDQMVDFGTLLNEWRAAVQRESQSSGRTTLVLSAAVFRSANYYRNPIPVEAVANSLDFINVMTYDYYAPGWSPNSTGAPAALYGRGDQVNGDREIRSWINAGFPANKIVFGLPFYGWAWKLENPNNNGYGAPANGAAAGVGIEGGGAITYNEIRNFMNRNGANNVYNDEIVSDYVYSGTTWIGYDDTQSIWKKVSYARDKGLRGYFAWQVSSDHHWILSRTASNAWAA